MSKASRSREELIALFVELGMSDKKAEETFKNSTLTKNLTKAIDEVSPYLFSKSLFCLSTLFVSPVHEINWPREAIR